MPLGYPLDPRVKAIRTAQWSVYEASYEPDLLVDYIPETDATHSTTGAYVALMDSDDTHIIDEQVIVMKLRRHTFKEIGEALGFTAQAAHWRWNRILRDWAADTLEHAIQVQMQSARDLDDMWEALKDKVTAPGMTPREQDVAAALKLIQVRRENAGLAGAGKSTVEINLNGLPASDDEKPDPEAAPGMTTVHAIEELTGLAAKVAGNMHADSESDDDAANLMTPLKTPVTAPGSDEPIHVRGYEDHDADDAVIPDDVLDPDEDTRPGKWVAGKFIADDE